MRGGPGYNSSRGGNGGRSRSGGRGRSSSGPSDRGGRGERSSRGRGGRSSGRGGNPRGGGGGRGRGGRRPMSAAESGNQRERIQIESGSMVLIDQFMLANPQVIEQLKQLIDEAPESKDRLIESFGGLVLSVSPGTYKIDRDPFLSRIVVMQQNGELQLDQVAEEELEEAGTVFIDTRCIAMLDRELLDDITLLEKYQQLWVGGQDKACRDLLRDNGGAVRYGFERSGDSLAVRMLKGEDLLYLKPDSLPSATDDSAEASTVA
jgi:hypothetical protein